MKRLDQARKNWHIIRSGNQRKRLNRKVRLLSKSEFHSESDFRAEAIKRSVKVKIWQGGNEELAISTRLPKPAPAVLCFERNPKETIELFSQIRSSFAFAIKRGRSGFISRPSKRKPPRIAGYMDFSSIEHIAMAAAVVLTADYDLLKYRMRDVPPTIDLRKWNPKVVTALNQLGFLNILGHAPDPTLLVKDGEFLMMRIIRSKNSDKLSEVDDALNELGRFVSLRPDVLEETIIHSLTIISEVMSNVTQHAYSGVAPILHNHMDSFWVAAEANKVDRTLRIVLYDQGATIPATFPRMAITDKVQKYFRLTLRSRKEFDFEDDGTYIRAALRYGGSRTELDYRGKGLPQMGELLDKLGGGEFRIISRGGWCVRSRNGKVTSGSHNCSICGTVVEWKMEL